MKVSLTDLKNTIKVAKFSQEKQSFSAKISTPERDVFIKCTYYPFLNRKEDIFPYWEIESIDEEFKRREIFTDIKEVRDTYNLFMENAPKMYYQQH